jgi:hypothetical protein
VERHFDSYIEQREGLKVIQNPHEYLEPEFVDEETGRCFYKNPFYKPEVQPERQSYSSHYGRNNYYHQQQRNNNFHSYPYPNNEGHTA